MIWRQYRSRNSQDGSGILTVTTDHPSGVSEPAHSPARRPYFPALDGVRAIAALMVMWFHGNVLYPLRASILGQTGGRSLLRPIGLSDYDDPSSVEARRLGRDSPLLHPADPQNLPALLWVSGCIQPRRSRDLDLVLDLSVELPHGVWRATPRRAAALLVAGGGGAVLPGMAVSGPILAAALLSRGSGLAWFQIVKYSAATGTYACLVGLLVVTHGGWAHRFLASKPMRAIGRVSYGLYVFHRVVLAWSSTTWAGTQRGRGSRLSFLEPIWWRWGASTALKSTLQI